jgi:predicted RNA-binding protein with PUA-like domain
VSVWFFSTEPDVYPWTVVEKEGKVRWDGIRGTAARKWMRDIKPGDPILGYHSSPEKSFVCIAQAASAAYPDPKDPDWLAIDVSWGGWLKRRVPLAELRAHKGLALMKFVRMPRLSVSPVTPAELKILSRLSETPLP